MSGGMNDDYAAICGWCRASGGQHRPVCDAPPAGWEQGGQKFDQNKPRMDLMDPYALEELSKVLTFGATKYGADNWRKGISMRRLIAASLRHLLAINRGEDHDAETGLQHASHLMCCAMFITWTLAYRRDMDDRYRDPTGSTLTEYGQKARDDIRGNAAPGHSTDMCC